MKLEFAFLADAATVLENGLFDVIGGGLDIVRGREFPATKYGMALIGRIVFESEECGKTHEMRGTVIDKNGKTIYPDLITTFAPSPPRNPKAQNWLTVCLNYQGVNFPVPGHYVFQLWIENRLLGGITIEAVVEEDQP